MKTIFKTTILVILVIILGSCNNAQNEATITPTSTETIASTSTTIIEPTPEPSMIPTQTSIPQTDTPSTLDLPTPSGKPDEYWEEIQIMPGALAGEGDSTGYSFTIDSSIEQIQNFYQTELSALGWNLFASGQGTTEAVLMIFMKNANTLSVSIIPQSDGIMYVLLVK